MVQSYHKLILKKGKDKPVRAHHHWIFSGAVAQKPACDDGDLVAVCAHDGTHLGYAYYNNRPSICARMLTFDARHPHDAIRDNIRAAAMLRKKFLDGTTNAYRLVHAEADRIPGLVIDIYGDYGVLQSATRGIDRLKEEIAVMLKEIVPITALYERSTAPARREEGLSSIEGPLFGTVPELVEITENDACFFVALREGQKTGFFLDQRAMRERIRGLAAGKRVLNCFSYSGGFTIAALRGGAVAVDSVDISAPAAELLKQNLARNGFSERQGPVYVADVFDFLRTHELAYDIIVLDPPAFAKKKADVRAACRGYKEINYSAIKGAPSGSLVLTCSCSYYIDSGLFKTVIFQAARDAGREVQIIGTHALACDHPINIYHPETEYLKSFLLYVT